MENITVIILGLLIIAGSIVFGCWQSKKQKKEYKNTFWEVFAPCVNHKCVRYFSHTIMYVNVKGKRIYKVGDLAVNSCLGCIQCDHFSKVDRLETWEN